MRTVYKYPVPIDDHVTLAMPRGAELLHFCSQRGKAVLWALVDPSAPPEERTFRFAGTLHLIEEANVRFVGTAMFHVETLVFHLFEVLP